MENNKNFLDLTQLCLMMSSSCVEALQRATRVFLVVIVGTGCKLNGSFPTNDIIDQCWKILVKIM